MREIKFRAWDTNKKCWVGGNSAFHLNDQNAPIIEVEKTRSGIKIMQFTGLLDRHGKEIYEGDVVRMYGNSLDVVKWIESIRMVGFGTERIKAGDQNVIDTADVKNLQQEMARSEIIGNIYENPELLQDKNKEV